MVLRCHTRQMTAIGRRAATWGQSWSWNAARTAVSVLQRVPRNQSKWAVSSPFFWTGWRGENCSAAIRLAEAKGQLGAQCGMESI